MDIFNLTIQKNMSAVVAYLNRSSEAVTYGINGVSFIGLVFNISTLIVLAYPKFRHKFYDFLRCRCICNIVICIVGSFFDELPQRYTTVEYSSLYIYWFFIGLPMRIVFLASAISDILLISNRFITLNNRKSSVFYTLSKKVINYILYRKFAIGRPGSK
jgi:hypothetical protein